MSRLPALLALTLAASAVVAVAQTAPSWTAQSIGESSGGFTLSVRSTGKATVTFRGLGTIASPGDMGDLISATRRTYDDGAVLLDGRTTNDGIALPDDGLTSSWAYNFESQVLPDRSGIAFNRYSALSADATVDADSGAAPGIDLEIAKRFGGFGRRLPDNRRSGSWGAFLGFSVTDVKAETSGTIFADLETVTDLYTLDGRLPPPAPYSAPSSGSVTVIGPDGIEIPVTIDTTVLLGNRPYQRTTTVTPGAAEVEGFWKVGGTYASVRAGLWVRTHVTRRLAVRASAGLSYSLLGVEMRYDERLLIENVVTTIAAAEDLQSDGVGISGYFASFDLEYWLTSRTGFFAGLTYERVARDLTLTIGGREADFSLASGAGFRVGLTTLF